jgi:hypothetical protein
MKFGKYFLKHLTRHFNNTQDFETLKHYQKLFLYSGFRELFTKVS